jgi:hypothetical protein
LYIYFIQIDFTSGDTSTIFLSDAFVKRRIDMGAKNVPVRLPDADVDRLDEYRRSLKNPPTRPAAIVELMRRALSQVLPAESAAQN